MTNTKRNWIKVSVHKDTNWKTNMIKALRKLNNRKFRKHNKLGLDFNIIGSPSIWYM